MIPALQKLYFHSNIQDLQSSGYASGQAKDVG
jgi:hypothetical protein